MFKRTMVEKNGESTPGNIIFVGVSCFEGSPLVWRGIKGKPPFPYKKIYPYPCGKIGRCQNIRLPFWFPQNIAYLTFVWLNRLHISRNWLFVLPQHNGSQASKQHFEPEDGVPFGVLLIYGTRKNRRNLSRREYEAESDRGPLALKRIAIP